MTNIVCDTILDRSLDGQIFFGTDIVRGVTNNSTVEYLVVTGSMDAVIFLDLNTTGDYETSFFEDTLTSADGAVLANFNFKRSDTTTVIDTLLYLSPTVTSDGTLISESLAFGGERNSAVATGGSGNLILKPNSKYMLRYLNISNNAVDLSVLLPDRTA